MGTVNKTSFLVFVLKLSLNLHRISFLKDIPCFQQKAMCIYLHMYTICVSKGKTRTCNSFHIRLCSTI